MLRVGLTALAIAEGEVRAAGEGVGAMDGCPAAAVVDGDARVVSTAALLDSTRVLVDVQVIIASTSVSDIVNEA